MANADMIQIGPFEGGLNTYSDETAVLDTELVVCENFELDLDGSLRSRPPFVNSGTFPLGVSGNMKILGYYYGPTGTPFLVASDGLMSTYYFDGTTWTLITSTVAASALAQYNDLAWLQAPLGSTNPGGSWSPTAGFTAVDAIPKGDVLIAHKNRLWASSGSLAGAGDNGTRLYLSNVAAPTMWPGNFISIGPGDGQSIVQTLVYYNDLLIFKKNSIYRFSYSSDPTTGEPSKLSPDIGLADGDCVQVADGVVYFVYDDKVYAISNYQINQINQKVPLRARSTSNIYKPYSLSQFNKRLIVSYYDTMYVYSLRTQRWTTWVSKEHGAIGKIVSLQGNSLVEQAIAHSTVPVPAGGTRATKTLRISDEFTQSGGEAITCTVQTKNYNYESPGVFKRLFLWGVDAVFRGRLYAYANIIKVSEGGPTWDQLLTRTWDQLLPTNWDSIGAADSAAVVSQVDTSVSSTMRKFVKLGRGLRFRQIFFRLVFETDGTSNTAPVRLFAITTRVNTKQHVVEQVS